MADLRGYIRERGTKLEAVIVRPDGSKVTRSTGCTLDQRDQAQAILDAALEQLAKDQPRAAPTGPLTVKDWGERWIEDRRERGKLEWIYERGHLAHYVYPVLGDLLLADVTDVVMLDWARDLERKRGPSGKTPGPKYVRRLTATVRALFKEAVKRHFIERTPCIWDNTDLPELEANSRVVGDGFEVADVAVLTSDPRIPEERRVLYALEFLTGMRTGEAAARCWKDWEPDFLGQLGRLTAATAYSTRHHLMKTTKTRVEKWIPVHPRLAELLTAWHTEGFERFVGRPPTPDDLIVPATKGGARNNSYSWRMFQTDLERVGLTAARHYDTRSAFISMAEGAGADPVQVARITHASLNGAKDLYRRVRLYWPLMCEAVRCIKLPAGEGVAEGFAVNREGEAGPSESAKDYATFGNSRNGGRARESNPPAAPLSTTHRF
jgi:integrase